MHNQIINLTQLMVELVHDFSLIVIRRMRLDPQPPPAFARPFSGEAKGENNYLC